VDIRRRENRPDEARRPAEDPAGACRRRVERMVESGDFRSIWHTKNKLFSCGVRKVKYIRRAAVTQASKPEDFEHSLQTKLPI
jgi:hypothetical protein